MKTKHRIGMFLAILLLLPWAVMAAPVGKITNLQGNVDITVAGKAARIAVVGDAIQVGDIVRTKSKSRAEITFDGGNVMMLGENTRVGITQYMSGPDRNSSLFDLFRGKIQNVVKSVGTAGGRYEVHTPTSVCGVRGTTFFNFYLNGTSGSIFQEGSGYGYSKKNPGDVKSIMPQQGMFVSGAAPGAQVRSVSEKQLNDMKNATEISESSGSSGGTGSSSDTGASGGTGSSTVIGDAGVMGDAAGPGDNVLPSPPPPMPSPYTPPPIVVPPTPVEQHLVMTIENALFYNYDPIDPTGIKGSITGTSSDGGKTFSLAASGPMDGPNPNDDQEGEWNPAGGWVKGTVTSGAEVISGLSGFMMGLPIGTSATPTGAKALFSAIYIDSNGQAGFLTTPVPMTATFNVSVEPRTFSGTGSAVKVAGPMIASTSYTPSTILNIIPEVGGPEIGNISIDGDQVSFGSGNACQSNMSLIPATLTDPATNTTKAGAIGVWGGYGTGTFEPNGTAGNFTNKMLVHYEIDREEGPQIFFSDNVSGLVNTGEKEVRLSGTFLYMDEEKKATMTLNHVGYYNNSDYTSISTGTIQATATNLISQDLNNSIFSNDSGLVLYSSKSDQLNISDYGVGITTMSGSYTGNNPTLNLAYSYEYNLDDGSGIESIVSTLNVDTSEYIIFGAGANWTTAKTYVLGGEIKGIFDASVPNTWSATALSTRIETAAFMALAGTPGGRSKLDALNIPSVQVGTVSLSGNGSGWQSLSINDMGFYARTSDGTPQIWASKDVQGILTSANTRPTGAATLTGNLNGFQADFIVSSFGNNKWGAKIQGTGGFNGTNTFQGSASGTYAGTSVTGTASGTAHAAQAVVGKVSP